MSASPSQQPAPSGIQTSATDHDLLAALLDGASDYIYFKDRRSRFTKINRHMAKAFGLNDPSEAIGKSDFDIFTEEHALTAFEDEQQIMQSGIPLIGKTERETWANGRCTWVSSSKLPLRNREGVIVGLFGISRDVTASVEAEQELRRVNKLLVQASRQAGMAEVATGVLHNVGNILNTANVSASIVSNTIEKSKVGRLADLAALIGQHSENLGAFFSSDERGKQVPLFLSSLSARLDEERERITEEIRVLSQCLEHIKEIVNFQQDYARAPNVLEPISVEEVIDDAVRIHRGAFARHGVAVTKDVERMPDAVVDKHKLLQILVNLLHNAKYACDCEGNPDKRIVVRALRLGSGRVQVQVRDTGIGIPPENLSRIFSHGFTTRKEGHGYGLHSSALAAADMGGTLTGHSDGPGKGATFTLEFPEQRGNEPAERPQGAEQAN